VPPPDYITNQGLVKEDAVTGEIKLKSGTRLNVDFLSFEQAAYCILREWYGVDYEIRVPLVFHDGELCLGTDDNNKYKPDSGCRVF
jgi:hypothetical protein